MSIRFYKCINGCKISRSLFCLSENEDGEYSYKIQKFNYCPKCGAMQKETQEIIKSFFELNHYPESLKTALNLLLHSEPESAVREAVVVLENRIKELSGLNDSHGKKLVSEALDFTYDKQNGMFIKRPLIAINSLETESDFNEQEGIKLMLIGFFQGPRNLYMHNQIPAAVDVSVSLLMQVAFFLKLLEGSSITQKAHWIKTKISYADIISKMPKFTDRLILKSRMWLRYQKHRKSRE